MFHKKRHKSDLFHTDVWITNIAIEQALSDPDIHASDLVIFTESELAVMRALDDRTKVSIFLAKKYLSRGCTVTYYGEETDRGRPYEREENSPDRPKKKTGPKPGRRKRYPTLDDSDRIGQNRLFGTQDFRVRDVDTT